MKTTEIVLILTVFSLGLYVWRADWQRTHIPPVIVKTAKPAFSQQELEQIRRSVEVELRDWQRARK